MQVVEIYLFHGFLGLPNDWNAFERAVNDGLSGKNVYCRFHKDNLWIDFQEIIDRSPHGGRNYFDVWSIYKRENFSHLSQPKIFLGYSLGGRLLMNLPLDDHDNVIFSGYVSSHPGLVSEQERKERRMMDSLWHDNFTEMSWEPLMKMWNSQPIFKADALRPIREEYHYQRSLLSRYFKDWSLGLQEPRDGVIRALPIPQKWFYGEKDEKFKNLLGRMQKVLGPENCYEIPNSGHGILWNNPKGLAKVVVSEIIKSKAI